MVGGEASLTWCNFDKMTLGTWCPNDTDLSRLQHLNFGCKGECKSICWQQFTTLYFQDGFLIKSRNTQPDGQTLVTFVPLLLKVLCWTVGMPGFEKSGWLDAFAVPCAKSTGCLCSHFTVNLMVSVPGPFSQELLCRLTPHLPTPSSANVGVWVVMGFWWTFGCVEQSSITRDYVWTVHVSRDKCCQSRGLQWFPSCQK